MRQTLAIGVLVACGVGCGDEAVTPVPRTSRDAPTISDYSSPEWSAKGDHDPAVAEVNGASITVQTLKNQMKAYPKAMTRGLLRALVGLEVLAQSAHKAGLEQSVSAIRARREALVRTYLDAVFEKDVVPEKYPMENLRRDYELNKRHYWFKSDAWQTAHLHETCCNPKQNDCDTKAARQCFDQGENRLYGVYAAIQKSLEGKKAEPLQVARAMADYRAKIGDQYPYLRYEEFGFFYNPKKTHDWHVGRHDVFDEAVVRAVIAGKKGVLQPPVRSQFGWHLMLKLDHKAAQQKTVDDPEVIADIRRKVFPRFRQAMFRQRINSLFQQYRVKLETQGMEVLDTL